MARERGYKYPNGPRPDRVPPPLSGSRHHPGRENRGVLVNPGGEGARGAGQADILGHIWLGVREEVQGLLRCLRGVCGGTGRVEKDNAMGRPFLPSSLNAIIGKEQFIYAPPASPFPSPFPARCPPPPPMSLYKHALPPALRPPGNLERSGQIPTAGLVLVTRLCVIPRPLLPRGLLSHPHLPAPLTPTWHPPTHPPTLGALGPS